MPTLLELAAVVVAISVVLLRWLLLYHCQIPNKIFHLCTLLAELEQIIELSELLEVVLRRWLLLVELCGLAHSLLLIYIGDHCAT